jgi:hypothetical protein
MTDKQYVIRAAEMMGLMLIPPKRGNPGILGYVNINGYNKCVVDAMKWAEAKEQINNFARQRADAQNRV